MKSNAPKTAGSASTSVSCQNADSRPRTAALLISTALLIVSGLVLAQTLYKYKGPDGEWVYTDRAPEEVCDIGVGVIYIGSFSFYFSPFLWKYSDPGWLTTGTH